jgi:cobalt-zinc-cadmium efflux system membrane fusion protein
MKTKKILFIVTIILAAVLSTAVFKNVSVHGQEEERPIEDIHEDDKVHEDKQKVRLTAKEMAEFGIETAEAGPGKIKIYTNLPGEVALNADRVAHVVPRVPGIVRSVRKILGDQVRKGDVMAVLDSRELADTKSTFLAVGERVALAKANFVREEGLWKKKISSEKEYLEAKQSLAESQIEARAAEQKLHSLGFSEKYLKQLPSQPDVSFTRYEIIAPFDGTVIEKHITLGEALNDVAVAYVIADLNSVWVDISVYQKDIPFIRKELPVIISTGHGVQDTNGIISYVGPLVGEKTRTALARVVLPNSDGRWRPGLFITADIMVSAVEAPVVVPKTALQAIDGKTNVFIETEKGFSPEPVTIGRSNTKNVEITAGLQPGQRYVTKGAFTLKAHLSKGDFGDGHGH